MNMNGHAHDNQFLAALDRLEASLETPVVPGDLPNWLDRARTAFRDAGTALEKEVAGPHEEIFAEILAQDMALAARVDRMKEKDQELVSSFGDLMTTVEQLCDRAEHVEPHESKIDEQTTQLVDHGLSFVLESRKQYKAITTWYRECFNRDRGVAD